MVYLHVNHEYKNYSPLWTCKITLLMISDYLFPKSFCVHQYTSLPHLSLGSGNGLPSMAPIRVAIIGLSASAATSWAAEGHLPYLLLLPRARAHYEIVALLNSSVQAAEAARAHFRLPPR